MSDTHDSEEPEAPRRGPGRPPKVAAPEPAYRVTPEGGVKVEVIKAVQMPKHHVVGAYPYDLKTKPGDRLEIREEFLPQYMRKNYVRLT